MIVKKCHVATSESRAGCAYEAAGGRRIINERPRGITFLSQEGALGRMDFQVVAVNKARGSVLDFVESGPKVVFESEGAYVESKEGDTTRLRRCNGMWYSDARRVPQHIDNDDNKPAQRFQRQG